MSDPTEPAPPPDPVEDLRARVIETINELFELLDQIEYGQEHEPY